MSGVDLEEKNWRESHHELTEAKSKGGILKGGKQRMEIDLSIGMSSCPPLSGGDS